MIGRIGSFTTPPKSPFPLGLKDRGRIVVSTNVADGSFGQLSRYATSASEDHDAGDQKTHDRAKEPISHEDHFAVLEIQENWDVDQCFTSPVDTDQAFFTGRPATQSSPDRWLAIPMYAPTLHFCFHWPTRSPKVRRQQFLRREARLRKS
jgi:hypothetical protein